MTKLRSRAVAMSALFTVASLIVPIASSTPVAADGLSPDQAFVAAAYHDFLGRRPTTQEFGAATTHPLTTPAARSTVVTALSTTPEWISVTVNKFYTDTLGRSGDSGGVAYWVGMLSSHRLTVAQVAASFYASDEYFAGYGASSNQTWVTDLYAKILLRPGSADPGGVAYWTGIAASQGRYAVAYAFYQSNESRHTRVAALYQTLLGRAPDQSGWDYWANLIGTQGDLALAASLASSDEYYTRAATLYSAPTPPTAPINVTAVAGGGTQATVRWNAPDFDGYSPILSYTVTATPGGATCTTPALTCTVSGLNDSTQYTFTVTATNSAGTGPASTPSAPISNINWRQIDGLTTAHGWRARGMSSSGLIYGRADGVSPAVVCTNPCTSPTLLPGPPGYTNVAVVDVSDTGKLVGEGIDHSSGADQIQDRAIAWSSTSAEPTPLPLPPGYVSSQVLGFLPGGEILGRGVDASDQEHNLMWASTTDSPTLIPNPTGYTQIDFVALADSGEIIGYGTDTTDQSHPLAWTSPTAAPTVIPDPDGYGDVWLIGVSSSGAIVGRATSDIDPSEPYFVWPSKTAAPTMVQGNGYSFQDVVGISPTGTMFGSGTDPENHNRTLLWPDPTAPPSALPLPVGYTRALVHGITASGAMLGSGTDAGGKLRALMWASPTTAATVLPDVVAPSEATVVGITSDGEPIAKTYDGDGLSRGIVWAPGSPSPTLLPLPSGYGNVYLYKVTSGGAILAQGIDANAVHQSLVWGSATAPPTAMAVPSGYTAVTPTDTSASGEIIGYGDNHSQSGIGHLDPMVWTSATAQPTLLPTLVALCQSTDPYLLPSTTPDVLSSTGEIAGSCTDPYSGHEHLLAWASPAATPTDMVQPPGGTGVTLVDIAPTGLIVGSFYDGSSHHQGVVWTSAAATPTVLQAPSGYTDVETVGVTASGKIVGLGYDSDGRKHALTWASPSSAPTVIDTPPGYTNVVEMGVSAGGDIWLQAFDQAGNTRLLVTS